jgi:outer membrane protein
MPPARFLALAAPATLAASLTMLAPRPAGAEGARVLTLAEVERAAQEQPQVLVARAAASIAQGQADQARAPLLPQVTASAQYTRETGNFASNPNQRNAGAGAGTSLTTSFDYWQFDVDATQLIYDFGQASQRHAAAQKTAAAQEFAERTTRLQVTLGVRRAYFNARAMKELVGVADETLQDQDRHLVQVQAFVQVGTQPEIALAQQKAAVANAQVLLIGAQSNYEAAKAQLNQAAGLAQGTDYDVADETLGPVGDEDGGLQDLAAKAVAVRPEMATLDAQRQAQEATIGAAQGAFGPTLSAAAGASEVGLAIGELIPNWYGGLVLSVPIFQGGLTKAQVQTAEAGLENVHAQRSVEELQIRLDVDSARLAVRAAKATIPAADDAVTSAREQLTLAEQRYATGVGSIIELNDAQVVYTAAAAQAVQARYGLASARAQLLAALGRS